MPERNNTVSLNKEKKFRAVVRKFENGWTKRKNEELCDLCRGSGGCMTMALRQIVWPIILGSESHSPPKFHVEKHKDLRQVDLDVRRSLWEWVPCRRERVQRRYELMLIINSILGRHQELCYFQGYHDVVSVLLLVLGKNAAFCAAEVLSLNHLSEAMLPSVQPVVNCLDYVIPLIKCVRPKFGNQLFSVYLCGNRPIFAFSWILAWFSHNLRDLKLIARLFDFLIASHPLMILYVTTSVIIFAKSDIYQNCEDYASLHFFFQKNLEAILTRDLECILKFSTQLFLDYPPCKLQSLNLSLNTTIPMYFIDTNCLSFECNRKSSSFNFPYLFTIITVISILFIFLVAIYINDMM